MKQLFAAIMFLSASVSCIGSASASCLWPFGGWWGAGYGGGYGNYGAGYAPYVPATNGFYSANYGAMGYPMSGYAAGYGTSDCCAPACCNPCGTGGCGTGNCVGTTPAGSLKPETDSNFDKSLDEKKTYDEFDRDGLKSREEPLDRTPAPRPRTRVEPDPVDDFRPMGRSRETDPPTFGTGDDQINNKPPMDDPAVLPAVEPDDFGVKPAPGDSTFLDEDALKSDGETRREDSRTSVANRASGLNEVIAPKRLASRSLPSASSRQTSSFAGKTSEDKVRPAAPIRWISLPMPEGNARL